MAGGNLQDIRRRVRSVKNIQQITRAMKFVAASKLRRSQERILAARPYARRMFTVLNSLALRADPGLHPLLAEREQEKVMLVVITSDRGLCGAFSSNIIKAATRYITEKGSDDALCLTLVGRKGVDWFGERPWSIRHEYTNIMSQVDIKYAREIAQYVIEYYTDHDLDAVYLVYNEFKSVVQQNVVVEPLLPIGRLEVSGEDQNELDYIYEQNPQILFDHLLSRHVEIQLFRALLESEAAEHGARMTAMDSATKNAKEVIDKLTLHMNRIRQASITTELIEVVSGADALGK